MLKIENKIIELDPDKIDCSGPWLYWSKEPEDAFLACIQKSGVIEPILVSPKARTYELVSGYRRVWACRQIKKNIPCILYRNDDECQKGLVYFYLNVQKGLNPQKLVRFARFFQLRLKVKELEPFLYSELSPYIPSKELKNLICWLKLYDSWDEHLFSDRIPFEIAELLSRFSEKDLISLEPFFRNLFWSKNKAKYFLTWIFEIKKRDLVSVQEIIEQASLLKVLKEDLSPNDTFQELLYRIRKLRFPTLFQLECEFNSLQKEIKKSTRWEIYPIQHFEKNGFSLYRVLKNGHDARESLNELNQLIENGRFDDVFQWQNKRLGAGVK